MKTCLLGICAVLTAAMACGQGANGTITGTVADPSGAVVAGAEIRITNTATGIVINSASTATGNYVAPQLPVGSYDLSVSAPGFKTYNRVALGLSAAQTMRIDVTLEVGSAAESVTITAETPLLKTETGGLTHNVTVSQMKNLPVLVLHGTGSTNTVGFRDPYALATMIPGVNYTSNSVMIINGNPDDTMQLRVEGQTAGQTGNLRQNTAQSQPSVDAVEEVAVQTSNYSAEFGTAGGGIFNVTMKSGTNDFHGSVYDYAANESLNAYQPYTGLRNAAKRHDYGFTVGGPVRIPKVYDGRNRSFFFFSFEQFRERLMITSTTPTVPTAQYRAGDFSGLWAASANRLLQEANVAYRDPLGATVLDRTIFDPLTDRTVTCPATGANCTAGQPVQVRSAFTGNVIPLARFDPVAVNVLKLVPLPEGPNATRGQPGENFQRPWRARRRSDLPSIKIDQTIGSKGRLNGYYQFNGLRAPYSFPNGNMEGFPEPITGARGSFINSRTIRLNYDHTITPTVLLHLGAGWFSHNFDDHAPYLDTTGPINQQALLGLPNRGISRHFPLLTTASSVALGGMSNLGTAASLQANSFERRPSGVVNLSWVKGNHNYKFGSEYRLEKFPTRGFSNTTGNYVFNTNYTLQSALQGRVLSQGTTGFELASFLLGGTSGATLAVPLVAGTAKTQWSLFAQDTWKVTRKLTLDYGMRWDYGTYAAEQYGRYGSFSPTVINPAAGGHPGGNIYEATCKCNFAANYPYAIGPRIGFAYQLGTKTVVRGGYGVVYSAILNASGAAVNSANAGTPGFGQIVGQFKDGIPGVVQPLFPNFAADAGQPAGAVVAAPTLLDPNAGRPGRQHQWSIGVQREIHRNLVVEATYVANRGSWWPAGALAPINVMSEQLMQRYGFSLNTPADGTLLARQISALTTVDRTNLATKGVTVFPYAGYSTGQTVRQALLPFPQYNTNLAPAQAPLGNTWYDGLQLTVIQRFQRGLSFNFNYTASKALELMASPDVFNRKLGKDLQSTDVPQQVRMSAEYQIPSLKNSSIKALSNPVVSYALGDWSLGWFFQYQSAPTLALPANQGSQPISQWLGRGPGPAQFVSGQNLWSTNWVDYSGTQRTDPIDINCHCYDPTKNVVLNPAAWSNIPNGTWGAQQTTIRQFRGIRYPQENVNLSRNFRIKERVVLHIRIEFQNVMNRTRLPQPSTAAAYTASPTRFTTGANTGLFSGGFGTIVPTSGTANARTGAMIARITF